MDEVIEVIEVRQKKEFRAVVFSVTPELLHSMLRLPDTCSIYGVEWDWDLPRVPTEDK